MHLDFDVLPAQDRYKLLSALVIPRPVAWVTTQNADAVVNAAPYSFFNVFGQDPPLVILGLQHNADGSPKDTTRNIDRSGEFVVNLVAPDMVHGMVETAAAYPPDVGEPDALGLALEPSVKVAVPRLSGVPVALECTRMMSLSLSTERAILLGRVVGLATRDGLIDPDTLHVDWGGNYPVARLFADRYGEVHDTERLSIPEPNIPGGRTR